MSNLKRWDGGEHASMAYGTAERPIAARRRSHGLPLWSKGSIAVGVTLALGAAFLTRTLFQQGDWSDGALAVALAAVLLAAVTLLIGIVRALAGRRSRWTLIQTGLLLLTLLAVAVGSFATAPSLHATQAQAALRQSQWAEAIEEFALSGEHAPNAPGIAGAYVAWGEQLLAQQRYASAVEKFSAVATTYQQSGHTVVAQARRDLYRGYSQWMRADASHVRYGGESGALAIFQAYMNDPTCDARCAQQLPAMIAEAHYHYGQQLAASQRYAEAIAQFEAVTRQFASSAYANQSHAAAAQAYFAYGQQQVAARACSGAVATYTTLVAHYADAPEAARAKDALAAPQPVSGTLSGLPTNPTPTVALSSHVTTAGFIFSNDYTATPDAKGAFTLPDVAQGDYNLSTRRELNGTVSYTYYHDAKGNVYFVHVGPLCPVELGVIAYSS